MTGSSTTRRGLGALASVLAFGAYLVLSAVPASAAVTCVYDAVNRVVDIDITAGEDPIIRVGAGGSIELDPGSGFAACGIATVTNTDAIDLTATGANANTFTIDQSNGVFAPGESPEASGTSEIEFGIDLGPGVNDQLIVIGTASDDVITIGDGNVAPFIGAVNVNGDADADITVLSVLIVGVNGADGNDTISGHGGNGTGGDAELGLILGGGNGNDTVEGSDNLVSGANILAGGEGNDHLMGRDGPDVLVDGGLVGGPGAVDADGDGFVRPDEDEVDLLEGGPGDDSGGPNGLFGGEGNDTLRGGQGIDTVNGGLDEDLLDEEDGPNGADSLIGGPGIRDKVSYAGRNSDVDAIIGGGAVSGEFGEGDTIDVTVEDLAGGEGDDTLDSSLSTTPDNVVDGGPGDDSITTAVGFDILIGGLGNDALDGDGGFDIANFSDAPSAETVDLDAGTATGGDGNDTLVAIEGAVGSAFDDTLLGDEASNELAGGPGNDTMDGRDGVDFVNGGDGNDTINDTGDTAADGDFIGGDGGNDTIDSGIGNDFVGGDDGDDVTPDGADVIEGGEGDDFLDGDGGDDHITDSGLSDATDADNDFLLGGVGSDTLTSDEGEDLFDGDDGPLPGNGNDNIVSGADDDIAFGDDGDDTFTDTGADDGGDLDSDDEFFGGGGDDTGHLGQGDDLGVGDSDCLAQEAPIDETHAPRPPIDNGGPPGDDDLFGEDGDDELHGCDGDDLLEGGDGDDEADGDDDTDQIRGQAGEDDLFGDTGNDTVSGGPDDDDMDGGDGADTISFKQCGQGGAAPSDSDCQNGGVEADGLLGFAVGEGNDVISSFEILVGSAFDDILTGGGGTVSTNFRLKGGAGTDILTGSGSNDTLAGAKGDDVLRGGGGDDTMKGGKGNDEGFGGRGTDLCSSVETPHSCEIFA